MQKNNTVSVSFMLMGILFCVCLVASNMLGTKILQIGPFSLTAGIIVFPVSYILNDCIAEVWGFRKARLIIWMGFLMNFFVVALGGIAAVIPAPPFWEGEEAFRFVFGFLPQCLGDESHEAAPSRAPFLPACHHVNTGGRECRQPHLLSAGIRRSDASIRTGQDDVVASDCQDPLRNHRAAPHRTSRQVRQAS